MALGVVALLVGTFVLIRGGDRGRDVAGGSPSSIVASSTTTAAPTTTVAPTTTSTTAPTTTTTAAPGPASFTVAMAGDLLPHLPVDRRAAEYGRASGRRYDFGPMLAPMQPVVAGADLAICHLEVPLAPDQGQISGYPSFGAPDELLDAVKDVGYDGCSNASNHSLDRGRAGIDRTLAQMDARGLRHAGTARTAEEGAATTFYEVGGAKVAHLSYAYGFNGYSIPADAPFAANQIDVARIRADAALARRRGAALVIVSLHWGEEYRSAPTAFQREVASALLPSPDIDVIVGHHAHVVQPIEQVEGTYVVWGLGNQLSNQRTAPRADGLTVVLHAQKQPDGRYRISGIDAVPTYVEAGSMQVLPIVATLRAGGEPAALRAELEAAYDRTAAVLATSPTPGVSLEPRP